ncbi:Transcriptional regulator, DeoR family protein [Minicystis rosea]|nr:Transcriptional regulator, DeoR family protein [Minicystis rosea]
MVQTSARLLRLLTLLQSRRFWTGAELAERLEITERTVRRDVDRLRTLGYPVDAAAGVAGGYQLGAGASLPPLLLEDDEALAVSLGLRTAAAGTVAGMEEAALRALAKLEQVLPARLRRRLGALRTAVVPVHRAGPTVDAELLTALASASRDRQVISFRYGDMRARQSDRTVEPHGLVFAGSRWYLVAWDLGRDDFRTFRVDRVTGKVTTGASFVPRPVPGGDLAGYVSRSVSTDAYSLRARVILDAPLEAIAPRISPLAGRVERVDDTRCLLSAGAQSLGMLALYIAQLGVDFEVLEPPEFAVELRTIAARMTRAARRISPPRSSPKPRRAG